jgi:hypothetical protein
METRSSVLRTLVRDVSSRAVTPADFRYRLSCEDPLLRGPEFRRLMRPHLEWYVGVRGGASPDAFESMLTEVCGFGDDDEPPSRRSLLAAVARWRRFRARAWSRLAAPGEADAEHVSLLALKLFPAEAPSPELRARARERWGELARAWRSVPLLQGRDEADFLRFLDELEPINQPACQDAARRCLEWQREARAAGEEDKQKEEADATPQEREELLARFRLALVYGLGSLDEEPPSESPPPPAWQGLSEGFCQVFCASLVRDVLSEAGPPSRLRAGADALLAIAKTAPLAYGGLPEWVLGQWRAICAKAMAKWRPHDPKGSFRGTPALFHKALGYSYHTSPDEGPVEERAAPELETELLALVERHLRKRVDRCFGGQDEEGAPGDLLLRGLFCELLWKGVLGEEAADGEHAAAVAATPSIQLLREELILARRSLDAGLDDAHNVVEEACRLRAAATAAAAGRDSGALHEELRRHPGRVGLEADLESYLALATDSRLGLLSKVATFVEERSAVSGGGSPDQPQRFWPEFVAWLQTAGCRRSLSLLPECVNLLRLQELCPRCKQTARLHEVKERSADECLAYYLVCENPACLLTKRC